jgi:glycosyltransferase involved in cell wall biosynthesis
VHFAGEVGPAFFAHRYTIGYWFWEVDPLPASMHAAFNHVDEVWAATEYMAQIFRAAGRKPVFTVPLPLPAPQPTSTLSREQLGLPPARGNRFVFLFIYDFLSVLERKNPLGAIEAFCAAFAPDEGPVLVLKSISGHRCVPQLERVRRAAAHRPDIIIRDGYVSPDEKNALLAACDCYVSLHRAEGLGLTLAEAMALGKPAIATGYSGNRHFMSDENSFLVEYSLASASGDYGPYPAGARWAEPSVDHAARLMRAVYEHPEEAARRGDRARADLLFHHGVMSSASAIARRLASIREERAAAAAAEAAACVDEPPPATDTLAAAHPPTQPESLVTSEAMQPELPLAALAESSASDSSPSSPIEPAATAVAPRSPALDAFDAAVPQLRLLGHPRLSADGRAWPMLRRVAQRAMFRVIRPYWYQQRQFQDALLEAVHASIERLTSPGDQPTSAIAEPAEPKLQPLEPGRTSGQ